MRTQMALFGLFVLLPAAAAAPKPAPGPAARRPAAPAAGPAGPARARELFAATVTRLRADRDLAQARRGFGEAAALDPAFGAPRYNLGAIAEREGQWAEAVRWFEEYLRVEPDSPLAGKARTRLAVLKARAEEARDPAKARRARVDAAVTSARKLLETGRLPEAVAESQAAAALDDSRWEAHLVAAEALSRLLLFEQAAEAAVRALRGAPEDRRAAVQAVIDLCAREKSYRAHHLAGAQALASGRFPEAIQALQAATQLFADRGETALLLASALSLAGDVAKALGVVEPLKASADRPLAARAQILSRRLAALAAAGEAARREPPAPRSESPDLASEAGNQLAALDGLERQAQAETAAALTAAREQAAKNEAQRARLAEQRQRAESRLEAAQRELESAQMWAQKHAESAQQFSQQADYYSRQGRTGVVSAAIARAAAISWNSKANSEREKANRLRQEVASLTSRLRELREEEGQFTVAAAVAAEEAPRTEVAAAPTARPNEEAPAAGFRSGGREAGYSYSGPYREVVQELLNKGPSWRTGDKPDGSGGVPPQFNLTAGDAIRDTYIAAATLNAWAVEAYARIGKTEQAREKATVMMEELRKAMALCSDAPVVGGGGSLKTGYITCAYLKSLRYP